MSNIGETITSAGNSWIICRSKTYAGRIYYFNTLTGEAAWNLSLSEVEKAKKRTSILESESNFKMDNCPEPMSSPTDELSTQPKCSKQIKTTQKITPSKVYNKQIINNQFTKPPCSYTDHLQAHYSSINPIPFNLALNPSVNQGVWNITPQPIFVAPGVVNSAPSISQFVNGYDCVPVTNTSMPLSKRFMNIEGSSQNTSILPKRRVPFQFNSENMYNHKPRNFINRSYNANRGVDLREFLSTKKKKMSGTETNEECSHDNFDENETSNLHNSDEKKKKYLISLNDDDEKDDHLLLEKSPKTTEILDLAPLKKLLQIDNEFEVWFIVVDTNVILNNINFINMLLNSDSSCHLMLPQIVMKNIQNATNTRLRTRAHRAAYFISQKVDVNVAVIDQNSEESSKDQIINSCAKLIDQGYHVILITDDIELHSVENNVEFQVFTVRDVKQILNNETSIPFRIKNSPDKSLLSRHIKITIPNDTNKTFDDLNECDRQFISPTESQNKINNFNLQKARNEHILVENFVQTDMTIMNTDVGVQARLDTAETNNETEQSNNDNFNAVPLKRCLSDDNNLKGDNKTKTQYNKWHRRKMKSNVSVCSKSSTTSETDHTFGSLKESTQDQLASNLSSHESHHFQTSNNYEDSSDSCSVKRYSFAKNVVIDETSTSESSNVESVVCVNNAENIAKQKRKTPADKNDSEQNVMFEVTSTVMEECLRTKSDEWISRFVQIMEEAMSQILLQDPPFILDTMLPPWTIYEATECIKRKFHSDYDTVDASTKLLNVLFEIGGLRGKIKIDINPNKYMEVYSYGVYLIDALQGLLNDSEDLKTAAESLSKLLSDIQDPHLNTSIQDTFNDIPLENVNLDTNKIRNDTIVENIKLVEENEEGFENYKKTELENNRTPISTPTQKTSCGSIISTPGKYNLRSQRKKILEEIFKEKEQLPQDVTVVQATDLESSFFTSLDLKKNTNAKNVTEATLEEPQLENDEFERQNVQDDTEDINIKIEANKNTECEDNEVDKIVEPKVIRNFTACPEFEKRLKLKDTEQERYDSWTHRREALYAYEENDGPDYETMGDQYYGIDVSNDYDVDDTFDNEEYEDMVDDGFLRNENDNVNFNSIQKNNINFKKVMGKMEHDIKEAFSLIYQFCKRSHSKLSSGSSSLEKNKIQKSAEKTYLYVNNLCDAFNSILTREKSDFVCYIQALFRIEEFQDIVFEDGDFEDYKEFITKCAEQGNTLKDSVQLIMEVVRQ